MRRVSAVLLAGDRKASKLIHHQNKAFLELLNVPFIIHILKALQEAKSIEDIIIIGPKEKLESLIQAHYKATDQSKQITIVEQGENLLANVIKGFDICVEHTLQRNPDQKPEEVIGLYLPNDIPLILPEEIDSFVNNSDLIDYDYCIGMTNEDALSRYYPSNGNPGIVMNYFHFKESKSRQNNLHIGRLRKASNLIYIEKMYELRYQTKLINIIKLFGILLKPQIKFIRLIWYFLLLQLSRIADEKGHLRQMRFFSRPLAVQNIADAIGNLLGIKMTICKTEYGGAALDIDNESDLKAAEQMAVQWKAIEQALAKKLEKD